MHVAPRGDRTGARVLEPVAVAVAGAVTVAGIRVLLLPLLLPDCDPPRPPRTSFPSYSVGILAYSTLCSPLLCSAVEVLSFPASE